jgi:hypothetical protein
VVESAGRALYPISHNSRSAYNVRLLWEQEVAGSNPVAPRESLRADHRAIPAMIETEAKQIWSRKGHAKISSVTSALVAPEFVPFDGYASVVTALALLVRF